MKLREIFADRLARAGYTPVATRSRKYIVMSRPDSFGGEYFMFLGKCGSLRWSRANRIAGSIPVSAIVRERMVDDIDWATKFLGGVR